MGTAVLARTEGADNLSAISLVAETERSRHFQSVMSRLELGGTVFGYVDIEDDALALGAVVGQIVDIVSAMQPQAAILRQDYPALFTDLGLNDIKAVGLSSVELSNGSFRNRVFLHTPDGRRGLLAGLGGPAAPFRFLHLAPPDTSFYFETEADLSAIYAALRGVIVTVVGEGLAGAVDMQLKSVGQESGVSVYDLVQRAKGRIGLIIRIDPERTITTPEGPTLPYVSVLARAEGIGPAIEPLLESQPIFERSETNQRRIFKVQQPIPVEDYAPQLVLEGDTITFVTNEAFLAACETQTESLATSPAMKQSLAALGETGNGLTYVSPATASEVARLFELNPELGARGGPMIAWILSALPQQDYPLVSVRTNFPDGILYQSIWHASLKQDLAVLAVYNPATLGLMASMGVPAFMKVRENSQNVAVQNNLRQIYFAGTIYCDEHGVDSVSFTDLAKSEVGEVIADLEPVAGEDYSQLVIKVGEPLRTVTRSGQTVEFTP